jgi:hypothetical protein
MGMGLRPQDLVVVSKAALWPGRNWTFAQMARELFLSASEVHAAVNRSLAVGLLFSAGDPRPQPNTTNLLEFLVHGAKYVFLPRRTRLTRGHPTAIAAPALRAWFGEPASPPPVWPHASGPAWGEGVSPLYPRAVLAALADQRLYSVLALVDALRIGGARERAVAADLLPRLLAGDGLG